MASPLERSKAELEKQGYDVWKVERPASMFYPTLDLYNLMDLVAIHDDFRGVLGIQCCGEDIAPHIKKIMEGYTVKKIKKNEIAEIAYPPNPYIKKWLNAGNRFNIWGWRLRKHEGTRATYQLREVMFYIEGNEVVYSEVEK